MWSPGMPGASRPWTNSSGVWCRCSPPWGLHLPRDEMTRTAALIPHRDDARVEAREKRGGNTMQRSNRMHRIRRILQGLPVGVAALAFILTGAAAQAQEKKPNIVVIMTDDVGWGDLGSYGGGVMRGAPTPHLDRLAAEGMRFVNYYGQASCTAGRASFITGRGAIPDFRSTRE